METHYVFAGAFIRDSSIHTSNLLLSEWGPDISTACPGSQNNLLILLISSSWGWTLTLMDFPLTRANKYFWYWKLPRNSGPVLSTVAKHLYSWLLTPDQNDYHFVPSPIKAWTLLDCLNCNRPLSISVLLFHSSFLPQWSECLCLGWAGAEILLPANNYTSEMTKMKASKILIYLWIIPRKGIAQWQRRHTFKLW